MRRLLNSLLVFVVCFSMLTIMPVLAFAEGEEGYVVLHIEKQCLTDPEDITPGAEVTYQLTCWATAAESEPVSFPVISDQMGDGLTLTDPEDIVVYGDTFEGDAVAAGDGFTMDIYDDGEPGFMTDEGQIVITYFAVVPEDAKAGDTLTNTATFGADDLQSVTDTETITVVDEEDGDDGDDDEDIDDGDDDNKDDHGDLIDSDGGAGKGGMDYSPDTGDHFLYFLFFLFNLIF